jgi:hypothetical protein
LFDAAIKVMVQSVVPPDLMVIVPVALPKVNTGVTAAVMEVAD